MFTPFGVFTPIGAHVSRLVGFAPTLPTPFDRDGSVDISALAHLCDSYPDGMIGGMGLSHRRQIGPVEAAMVDTKTATRSSPIVARSLVTPACLRGDAELTRRRADKRMAPVGAILRAMPRLVSSSRRGAS